jgi:ABC-type multidrug transport system, ATPase component
MPSKNERKNMLQLYSLTKLLKKSSVLTDISIALPNGVCLLTGPNGAGKTTFMRILAGVIAPTSGRVYLNGKMFYAGSSAFKAHIGYVPQSFGVYPEMTAEKFLRYFAELKGLPAPFLQQRVEDVMKITQLTEIQNKKLCLWTKGMRQKLGIAQALLNDPDLLLLDEPLAGLDFEERHYFCELFSRLGRERIVLVSSHIIEEPALADRVLLLHQQKVQFDGSPCSMLAVVRGFVWSAVMSEAEWKDEKHRLLVSRLEIQHSLYKVRFISKVQPKYSETVLEEPDLQDAYIYLVSQADSIRERNAIL